VPIKRAGWCRHRWTPQGWVLNYLYLPIVKGKPCRKRHVLNLKLKIKIDNTKEGDNVRKRQRERKIIWSKESSIVQSRLKMNVWMIISQTDRSLEMIEQRYILIMHIVGLYLMMNYPFPPSHEWNLFFISELQTLTFDYLSGAMWLFHSFIRTT